MKFTKKFLAGLIVAGALAGIPVASASAAHCVDTDGTTPGFSYFGTDHVKEADHAEGGNPGPHAGTSGASNCLTTSGNPSERAPGQNK
ncbi:MAG: hypothetical protein M3406_12700 [Chloroflexota bacterium]|nr:hypothetical protein [Chloroflexota bacterium]